MASDPTQNPATSNFDFELWFDSWRQEYLFYRLTPEGEILYIAPNVETILGYQPSEMVGRHVNEFLEIDHPIHALLQDLSDRLWPGETPMHRCIAKKRDGEELYLAARERMIFDDEGIHIATERMAIDDTDRVQAELSLRQSERRYRRLVEGIRGDYFIYTHDNQGVITYVSPSVKNVMGYDPDQVLGRNWRELVKEDYQGRQNAENVRQDIYAGKKFHRLIVEMDHAEKGTRLLELQVRQLYGPDGNFTSLEGIARDITELTNTTNELKQLKESLEERVADRTAELVAMNEQLTESEERYRSVVENQAEFIVHWTPDLRRTFVNEAYARYLGKPVEELVNQPFMSVIFNEDVDNFTSAMYQLTPENNSVTYEHRIVDSDGELHWVQWTDRAFFDDNGQAAAYLSVGRDVTALKEAEDELRQKELLIAHFSRLATMGELVAGIAHEVNQPLHAASAFAEAARRHLESGREDAVSRAVECMREITTAINRTGMIIRRLRDFTRRSEIEVELLSINELIRESLSILAYETRRAHVYAETQLAEGLPQVSGDRIQLQQVFVNLITNAYEAMSETPITGRTLTIRSYVEGKTVRVEFADTGPGIDEVKREQIFDAFVTTKEDGTGMGLSICQSIVHAHRGKLFVKERSDSSGACFVLELPYRYGALPWKQTNATDTTDETESTSNVDQEALS